ncbi:MAG: CRTAC1 family protein [Planctomycetes bacterium]|nr:CRTAC1 family protein [Planctomycetota bacterium]
MRFQRLRLATGVLVLIPACAPDSVDRPETGGASTAAKRTPTPGHQRMIEELARIAASTEDENDLLGSARIQRVRQALAKLAPDAPAATRFALLADLAEATVYYGDERDGLGLFQQAFDLPRAGIPDEQYQDAKVHHAAAWLRLAETENCCASHHPTSCILPLTGEAVHRKTEGSTNAVRLLGEVLAATDRTSPLHLKAKWFLNMGMMTLGKYPDAIAPADRIPWSFFAGSPDFPRFRNVAAAAGIELSNLAGGSVAEDFDNDGDIDLMLTSYGADGQLEYFRQEGGRFERRTEEAGLLGIVGGLNAIQADYDNDGFTDLFIPRGAWLGKLGLQPDSLLHNNGDGTFTDRAFDAGLAGRDFPNMTAVFVDVDNDGDLDLYVGNETDADVNAPNQLFRNDGNGKFTDIAVSAMVTNGGYSRSVVAGDFDNDDDQDLWCANLYEANRLYRNEGDGTFTDIAPQIGLTGPRQSYTSWFFDFDNDGNLDLHVNTFNAMPEDLAAAALGLPFKASLPALYLGDGRGGFRSVGRDVGLVEPYSCMGGNFGDFDNDGFLDFYAGTGRPMARDLVPDKAYRNVGGKYVDVTLASGLGHLQKGHGRSFADFDDDGDLDVFAQMGGAYRSDLFRNALYENPGFGNRFISVRLEGKRSNRSAIGARIRADIVEGEVRRSIHRTVGSGGSFGANPLRQQLGLGKASRVERLVVHWPTSGTTQTFTDVPLDHHLHIVEGEAAPRSVRPPRPVTLGGPR